MIFAVFYVLLARDLHLSPLVIGLFGALPAVGGLIGSLTARRIAERLGQGPTICLSALVFALPPFVFPFLHRDWTLGLLAVAQIAFWWAGVVYNITQVSFRQGLCPPHLLGRMNATIRFLVWGTMPLGALAAAILGSTVGVRGTLLIGAIGGLLPPLAVILSPLRTARELPSYVPDVETVDSLAEKRASAALGCPHETRGHSRRRHRHRGHRAGAARAGRGAARCRGDQLRPRRRALAPHRRDAARLRPRGTPRARRDPARCGRRPVRPVRGARARAAAAGCASNSTTT